MESTQNSLLNCLLYYQLTMINTHHVASKTLTGIKIAHMKTQHKTYIICTGVVLVVSPAAIVLARFLLGVYIKHTQNIKLTQRERYSAVRRPYLFRYQSEDTWSIMALIFENESYVQAYKGHFDNKTTIKIISVWWYLSHEIYGKNN